MRNDPLSLAEPVLELPPRQNSSWQSLHCQHRRHEVMTLRAPGKRRESKTSQKLYRPFRGLEGRRGSTPVPRTLIRPRDHPFRGHKSSPQWSSCSAFRYWQDKRVGQPEVLLAKLGERRQKLCPRIWRLSDFKSHPSQAIWRPAVLAFTDSTMEGPLHGLCDQLTIVRGLEKQQIWLDSCYCRPINQDGVLQTSQSHHWCSGTSGSHYRRGSSVPWSIRLKHDR